MATVAKLFLCLPLLAWCRDICHATIRDAGWPLGHTDGNWPDSCQNIRCCKDADCAGDVTVGKVETVCNWDPVNPKLCTGDMCYLACLNTPWCRYFSASKYAGDYVQNPSNCILYESCKAAQSHDKYDTYYVGAPATRVIAAGSAKKAMSSGTELSLSWTGLATPMMAPFSRPPAKNFLTCSSASGKSSELCPSGSKCTTSECQTACANEEGYKCAYFSMDTSAGDPVFEKSTCSGFETCSTMTFSNKAQLYGSDAGCQTGEEQGGCAAKRCEKVGDFSQACSWNSDKAKDTSCTLRACAEACLKAGASCNYYAWADYGGTEPDSLNNCYLYKDCISAPRNDHYVSYAMPAQRGCPMSDSAGGCPGKTCENVAGVTMTTACSSDKPCTLTQCKALCALNSQCKHITMEKLSGQAKDPLSGAPGACYHWDKCQAFVDKAEHTTMLACIPKTVTQHLSTCNKTAAKQYLEPCGWNSDPAKRTLCTYSTCRQHCQLNSWCQYFSISTYAGDPIEGGDIKATCRLYSNCDMLDHGNYIMTMYPNFNDTRPACVASEPRTDFKTAIAPVVQSAISNKADSCQGKTCAAGVLVANSLLQECLSCDLILLPDGAVTPEKLTGSKELIERSFVAPGHIYSLLGSSNKFQARKVRSADLVMYFNDTVFYQLSDNMEVRFEEARATDGSALPDVKWWSKEQGFAASGAVPEFLVVGGPENLFGGSGLTAGNTEVAAKDTLAKMVSTNIVKNRGVWHAWGDKDYLRVCSPPPLPIAPASTGCPLSYKHFSFHLIFTGEASGAFLPIDSTGNECYDVGTDKTKAGCLGGSARKATAIKSLRAKYPGNSILVDAGGAYARGSMVSVFKGAAAGELMKDLGYEVVTEGMRGFQGANSETVSDTMKTYLTNYTGAAVMSNIRATAEPWLFLNDRTKLFHVSQLASGHKVGFISLITADLATKSAATNMVIDPMSTAVYGQRTGLLEAASGGVGINMDLAALATELRSQYGVSVVILLSACDGQQTLGTLKHTAGIDAAIASQDTFTWNQYGTHLAEKNGFEWEGGHELSVTSVVTPGKRIPVMLRTDGTHLGHLRLDTDSLGNVLRWSSSQVALDDTVADDPEVWKKVKSYAQQVSASLDKVIAVRSAPLEIGTGAVSTANSAHDSCRSYDCPVGRFVTDALFAWASGSTEPCDLSFINTGGIAEGISAGDVTQRQVNKVLPFSNEVTVLRMSGSVLKQVLIRSIASQGAGGWLQLSGVRIAMSSSQVQFAAGGSRRLTHLNEARFVGAQVCQLGNYTPGVGCSSWGPIQNEAIYKVATIDFLETGGDGYTMLKESATKVTSVTGPPARQAVADYMKKSTVSYPSFKKLVDCFEDNKDREGWEAGCRMIDTTGPVDPDVSGKCQPGYRFDEVNAKCIICPAGTRSTWNFGTCLPCEPGTFNNASAQSKCTGCAKGAFQNVSGQTVCNDCAMGQYAANPLGAVLCSECRPGTFNDKIGQSECTRCGVGMLSESKGSTVCTNCGKHLSASSTLFQGASSPDDCICMKGNYNGEALLGKRGCVACSEGLNCDEDGLTKPGAMKGYYIHDLRPDQVYLCEPPEACIGGKWAESVCRPPRLGFMCTECPDGLTRNNDLEDEEAEGCEECPVITLVIVIVVPVCIFALVVLVMANTPATPLDENPSVLEAQNTVGQLVMFVQVVNAVFATQMLYGDPLNSFMGSLLVHLDPDSILSNTPCVSDSIKDPLTQYALVIAGPLLFIACLALVYIVGFFVRRGTFRMNAFVNIIGEVLVEFYISVTLAIFAPFQCYAHPNGSESVQKYPQVICGEGDHHSFMGLSVFGILAYPLPVAAVSLFMTWQFPKSMAKSDISILMKFAFLFERLDPECYWFCNVAILRNFLIAVLPTVMTYDQLDITILLMTLVLVIALILLIWFKPRRSRQQNLLDVFISFVQIVVLSFGVSTVHGTVLKSSLSTACVVLMASVIGAVCFIVAVQMFQVVSGNNAHSIYLCHHSGAGGSACRVLHCMLCTAIGGRVFFDIDNLSNLGMLLDAASISKNMIVAIGSETMCREWCIGAIACFRKKNAGLHTVMFTDPTPEETMYKQGSDGEAMTGTRSRSGRASLKHQTASFEVEFHVLRGFGIPQDEVYLVIQDLAQVLPVIMNFRTESEVIDNMDRLFADMLDIEISNSSASVAEGYFSSSRCLEQWKGKDGNLISAPSKLNIIIVCDNFDGEAVAASRLLQSSFSKKVTCVEDQDLAPKHFASILNAAKPVNCVFMFTQGTLKSSTQLARLGLIVKYYPDMHMVPVGVSTSSEFPDEAFIAALEGGKLLDLGSNPGLRLAAAAGDTVELHHISEALAHVMNFLILFIHVPKLKQSQMEQAILRVLDESRAASNSRQVTPTPESTLEEVTLQDGDEIDV